MQLTLREIICQGVLASPDGRIVCRIHPASERFSEMARAHPGSRFHIKRVGVQKLPTLQNLRLVA